MRSPDGWLSIDGAVRRDKWRGAGPANMSPRAVGGRARIGAVLRGFAASTRYCAVRLGGCSRIGSAGGRPVSRLGHRPTQQQEEPTPYRHTGECGRRLDRPDLDEDRGKQGNPQWVWIAP
jgi:hypothetical protein